MTADLTDRDWAVRLHIYRYIIDNGHAPSVDEIAAAFDMLVDDTQEALHRLERRHQIVLEPGTDDIRMAIPLSAIPTSHRVRIDRRCHYANCAWDSLGVAAMLHTDADIEAEDGVTGERIRYAIRDGKLETPDGLNVHFPVPLRRWYDNIVNT